MTAPQLAGELEVSVRTVYRDIEALSAAGVPVWAEAGPSGGYRLVDGYRTRLNGLSVGEAEALLMAGAPGPVAELGLGTVFAAAQAKLLAALPDDVAARAFVARQRFHVDTAGWFRSSRVPAQLPEVAAAVWAERRLRIAYRPPRSPAAGDRVVDPLGLVLKAGVWYLVARRDDGFRTYRVSRMERVETLDEPVVRPDGFDLARHWQRSVADYEADASPVQVTVSATTRAVGLLSGTEPAPTPSGWHRHTVAFEDADIACEALLGLGPEVEVLDPPELRQQIAILLGTAAALYVGRQSRAGTPSGRDRPAPRRRTSGSPKAAS